MRFQVLCFQGLFLAFEEEVVRVVLFDAASLDVEGLDMIEKSLDLLHLLHEVLELAVL